MSVTVLPIAWNGFAHALMITMKCVWTDSVAIIASRINFKDLKTNQNIMAASVKTANVKTHTVSVSRMARNAILQCVYAQNAKIDLKSMI